MIDVRIFRRALITIALAALLGGLGASFADYHESARWIWAAGTIPVVISLAISIVRDILSGRVGVDAVAFLSMVAAVALGQGLAGVIIAIMYAGGNVLEDYAVGRAERDLKSLVDRAPRVAHRRVGEAIEDVPVDQILIGDAILVRAGEVIPVDGVITCQSALLDEAAVTGEPIPVVRRVGEAAQSGAINAGDTLEMRASATASESTYAGIVRMVTAAQTAKAPFIRVADRYALVLLPVTLLVAGAAWLFSHDPVRGLAVLVAATPCPLILAAPVAFIAGTAQAARRGILIKGGGPLEALARTYTAMFDKTGTLTVGGARLVAIETAPGQDPDKILQFAASLEQASHHVVAAAIVSAAQAKDLTLLVPEKVRETLGSGLEGIVGGKAVRVGSHQLVYGGAQPEEWALRALRRASWRSALSVFVSIEGSTIGALLLADELRRETPRAIHALRAAGVARIVMVTGDRADAAETIGAALGLDAVLADRVPSDKVDAVATEQRLHPTLMVGDGINDAPALAAADVGIALGARGASASSEAADVVILVDELDRVSDAVVIARRTRAIALQSIIVGMALSTAAMGAAALGWLMPVAGALTQEAIDVAVILNALRALSPGKHPFRVSMAAVSAQNLRQDHQRLETNLDRLRQIADALDEVNGVAAVDLIQEANHLVIEEIVAHEREDESSVYPQLSSFLPEGHGLFAMSRAHREILHQARLLAHLADGLRPMETDRYLIRDAQRIIESIESLVRLHNAQEEDIYEHTVDWREEASSRRKPEAVAPGTASKQAVIISPRWHWRRQILIAALVILASAGGLASWSLFRGTASHFIQKRGSIVRTVLATGTVTPVSAVPVKASVSGIIQSLPCDINMPVRVGQLCATIDPRPYQVEVDRAKTNLIEARSRLENDKMQLVKTKAVLQRHQSRAQRQPVSQNAVKTANKAYDEAQAWVALDETAIAQHEAALNQAKIHLNDTNISSPVDGIVLTRNVEIGQTVTSDSEAPPIFLIATDLTIMQMSAKVSKTDIGNINLGDKASFMVESIPNRTFEGKVVQIQQSLRGHVMTHDVIISAPNPDLLLKPGMIATIQIVVDRQGNNF